MFDLDEILNQLDLKALFDDQGIGYRSAGSTELKLAECPFCGGRDRAYISTVKKRGVCFRGKCGQRFSLFSLMRKILDTDNKGTVQFFKRYAGTFSIGPKKPQAVSIILSTGWELPANAPLPTPEGNTHPFLVRRGITLETQGRFGLRWCEKGYFYYKSPEGQDRAQDYSGRIILPVMDLNSVVQTFQGRDATGTSSHRYLFPPGLPGSGRFLYGAHLARGKPNLVINEGVFDVLATHQAVEAHADFQDWGAVGTFGLSIGASDEQGDDQLGRFRQLRTEGLKRVVIMWDGEYGAVLRALDAARQLRSLGLDVAIALLPPGKDPNEVDTATVRQAIVKAVPFTLDLYILWKLSPPSPIAA